MSFIKRLALILIVLVGCVGCDQTTKSIAQSYLSSTEAWSFLGDIVRLQLIHNAGAFLGLGAFMPDVWRYGLFTVGGTALAFGLFGYALFAKRLPAVGVFALALLVAGGVGNVIDRWVYGGYVVDFINLGVGPVRTGIFNVADMFVMAGAFMLIISQVQGAGLPTPPQTAARCRRRKPQR